MTSSVLIATSSMRQSILATVVAAALCLLGRQRSVHGQLIKLTDDSFVREIADGGEVVVKSATHVVEPIVSGTIHSTLWYITKPTGAKEIEITNKKFFYGFNIIGTFEVQLIVRYGTPEQQQNVTIRVIVRAKISRLTITSDAGDSPILANTTYTYMASGVGTSPTSNWTFAHDSGTTDSYLQQGWSAVQQYNFPEEGAYTITLVVTNGISTATESVSVVAETGVAHPHILHDGQVVDGQTLYVGVNEAFVLTAETLGSIPKFVWTLRDGVSGLLDVDPCNESLEIGNGKNNVTMKFSSPGLRYILVCVSNRDSDIYDPLHVEVSVIVQTRITGLVISPSMSVLSINGTISYAAAVVSGSYVKLQWTFTHADGNAVTYVVNDISTVQDYKFLKVGTYSIEVLARNEISSDTANTTAVVQLPVSSPHILRDGRVVDGQRLYIGVNETVVLTTETFGSKPKFVWTSRDSVSGLLDAHPCNESHEIGSGEYMQTIKFSTPGLRYILVCVSNRDLDGYDPLYVEVSVLVQTRITGLVIIPSMSIVSINSTISYTAAVVSGSHVKLQWTFTHADGNAVIYVVNDISTVQDYKFLKVGTYSIEILARNEISSDTANTTAVVQLPVSSPHILRDGQVVDGQRLYIGVNETVVLTTEAFGSKPKFVWTSRDSVSGLLDANPCDESLEIGSGEYMQTINFRTPGLRYILVCVSNRDLDGYDPLYVEVSVLVQTRITGLVIIPSMSIVSINSTISYTASVVSGSHVKLQWTFTHADGNAVAYVVNDISTKQDYTFLKVGTYSIEVLARNEISSDTANTTAVVQLLVSSPHILRDGQVVDGQRLYIGVNETVVLTTEAFGSKPKFVWTSRDSVSGLLDAHPCNESHEIGSGEYMQTINFRTPGLRYILVCVSNRDLDGYDPLYVEVSVLVQTRITGLVIIPSMSIVSINSTISYTAAVVSGSHVKLQWTFTHADGNAVAYVVNDISTVQDYKFLKVGTYSIEVLARNEISSDTANTTAVVQLPVSSPHILRDGRVVDGQRLYIGVNETVVLTTETFGSKPKFVWTSRDSVSGLLDANPCNESHEIGSGEYMQTIKFLTPGLRYILVCVSNRDLDGYDPLYVEVSVLVQTRITGLVISPSMSIVSINSTISYTASVVSGSHVKLQWTFTHADGNAVIYVVNDISTVQDYKFLKVGTYSIEVLARNEISSDTANTTAVVQLPVSSPHILRDGQVVDGQRLYIGVNETVVLTTNAFGSKPKFVWTSRDGVSGLLDAHPCNESLEIGSGEYMQTINFRTPGLRYILVCVSNRDLDGYDPLYVEVSVLVQTRITGLTLKSTLKSFIPIDGTVNFEAFILSGSHVTVNWIFTDADGYVDRYILDDVLKVQNYTFLKAGAYSIDVIARNNISSDAANTSIVVQIPVSDPHILYNGEVVDGQLVYAAQNHDFVLTTETTGSNPMFVWTSRDGVSGLSDNNPCSKSFEIGSGENMVKIRFSSTGLRYILVCVSNKDLDGYDPLYVEVRVIVQIQIEGLSIVPSMSIVSINSTIPYRAVVANGSHIAMHWTFAHESGHVDRRIIDDSTGVLNYTFLKEGRYSITVLWRNNISNGVATTSAVVQIPVSDPHILYNGRVVDGRRIYIGVNEDVFLTIRTVGSKPKFVWTLSRDDVGRLSHSRSCNESSSIGNGQKSLSLDFSSPGLRNIFVCVSNEDLHDYDSIYVQASIWVEVRISNLTIQPSWRYFVALNETVSYSVIMTSGSNVAFNLTFTHESGYTDHYSLDTGSREYTFLRVGNYSVEVTATNNISSKMANLSVVAKMRVSDPRILYDGQVVNDRRLSIAINESVELRVTVVGSNPKFLWTVRESVGGLSNSSLCNDSFAIGNGEESLSLVFSATGLRYILLCASDRDLPMYDPIYSKVAVHVYDPIRNEMLSVYPATTVVINTNVTFTITVDGGLSTLYNWTIIDALGSDLTNFISDDDSIVFSFARESKYVVSVVPSDEFVRGHRQEAVVFVQHMICFAPTISAVTLPLVQEHVRSRLFRLEVSAMPSCSLFTQYAWKVYRKTEGFDCAATAQMSEPLDMDNINTDSFIITVPRDYLSLGTYCFRFEASVSLFLSSETFTIAIIESKLVAAISGGQLRLVGVRQRLTLDGSDSYDPDDRSEASAFQDKSELSYLWTCFSVSSSNDSCEGIQNSEAFESDNDCLVNNLVNTSTLTIAGNTLQTGRAYLFVLELMKGNRTATASQQVKLSITIGFVCMHES